MSDSGSAPNLPRAPCFVFAREMKTGMVLQGRGEDALYVQSPTSRGKAGAQDSGGNTKARARALFPLRASVRSALSRAWSLRPVKVEAIFQKRMWPVPEVMSCPGK